MSDTTHRAPVVSFGPDRRLVVASVAGAVVTAVTALAFDDAAGRLMFAIATVVLLVHAAINVIYTPRLVADAYGLHIRTPATRVTLAWHEIDKVGADVRTRLGLRSTTLEVDAGAVLVVFSRWALGVEPDDAARLIAAMDPRGR